MSCIYLVNDNPFYMLMAYNSISMLRRRNSDVNIKVLFVEQVRIGGDARMDRGTFFGLCENQGAEVKRVPDISPKNDPSFFPLNKSHLADLAEDEILFIDADTFVSGDVKELFDDYDADFVGCENRWMGEDWGDVKRLEIRPFNSGVLLCRNGVHRSLFRKLPEVCLELKTSDGPLARWIQNGFLYNSEEFGISLLVQRDRIASDYFKKQDVHNILLLDEVNEVGNSKIFHTYANQWIQTLGILSDRGDEIAQSSIALLFPSS